MPMQFTINASLLLQALKRIHIRRSCNMDDMVQLHAQGATLTLRTRTIPPPEWVTVKTLFILANCSLTEGGLVIGEEGERTIDYQRLVDALKAFTGTVVMVQQKGNGVLVERVGDALKQQTPVPGVTTTARFCTVPIEVGTTYTQKDTKFVPCAACGNTHREDHTDIYRLCDMVTQRLRIPREHLISMLAQVMWAVGEEERYGGSSGRSGIRIDLSSNGVFSLQAYDGASAALRSQSLLDGGGWQHAVLVPAKAFSRVVQLLPKYADIVIEVVLTLHQHLQRDAADVTDATPFVKAEVMRLYTPQQCITLSLTNASVPDYRADFLQTGETQVICATADLQKALHTVKQAAVYGMGTICLRLSEASLGIEVPRKDAEAALHEIPLVGSKTGPDSSVTVPYCDMEAALKVMGAPQVIIEIRASAATPEKVCVTLRANGGQGTYQCVLAGRQA